MGKKSRSIEARVIFKAIDIINGNACHFITFEELSTKERVYLQVGIGNYMMIVEGDRGVLHYKEQRRRYKSKFRSFERAIYAVGQKSTILEEYHENEVAALDEEVVAVLEAEKMPVMEEKSESKVEDVVIDSKSKNESVLATDESSQKGSTTLAEEIAAVSTDKNKKKKKK